MNEPGNVRCRACGAELALPAAAPVGELASGESLKAEIAYLEMRLRALSRRVHASDTVSDGHRDPASPGRIESLSETLLVGGEPPADGRIADGASGSGRVTAQPPGVPHATDDASPGAGIDIGTMRLSIGGPHGARLDVAPETTRPVDFAALPPVAGETGVGPRIARPAVDRRPAALAAVGAAFAGGARSVWIEAEPGAGATMLLDLLEGAERAQSHAADVIRLEGAPGPPADVIQLIAQQFAGGSAERGRYVEPALIRSAFAERTGLVLLDGTHLSDEDLAQIAAPFARLRFVAVRSAVRGARDDGPDTATIVLGPLTPEATLALLTECYGRPIAADNRDVALDLCATLQSLPGPTRIIAAAAREMGRSFIAVRARFDRGEAVVAAFVRSRNDVERRIVRALFLAGGPLCGAALAAIVAAGARPPAGQEGDTVLGSEARDETEPIAVVLERLIRCELVRPTSDGRFALAGELASIERAATGPDDAELLERIADRCSFDAPALTGGAALDRWCATAERALHSLVDRGHWPAVLRLGPLVGDRLAVRGYFGAWGRALDATAIAATHAADRAALDRVRHECGVRSALCGEPALALTVLRLAAAGRTAAGDAAGAQASNAVIAIVERGVPDGDVAVHASLRGTPPDPALFRDPPPRTTRGVRVRALSLRGSILRQRAAGRVVHGPARVRPGPAPRPQAYAAIPDAAFVEDARLFGGSGRPAVVLLVVVAIVVIAALAIMHGERRSAAPAIARMTLTPTNIARGSAAQLCVDVGDAAVVEVFPNGVRFDGSGASGRACRTVRPAMTTTYIAVATAADGRQTRSAATLAVSDGAEDPRIASFAARPARIRAGGSTRLCYAVSGARLLRIVPGVGDLTRLQSCRTLTLHDPHRYTFSLAATGSDGRVVMRQARIDVVPAAALSIAHASKARDVAAQERIRRAVYQFDATPGSVQRGQTASLCVGVERPARAFVTHIGRLQPGITRCYRVHPQTTTVYRLYLTVAHATAMQSVTVAVQPANRRRDVARVGRR